MGTNPFEVDLDGNTKSLLGLFSNIDASHETVSEFKDRLKVKFGGKVFL